MGDEHIGARVRRIRLWRGMTQAQVAGLAGWSTSAVSMLETGATGLDSRTRLAQLADALRVSPAELVGQPYPLGWPGLAEAQQYVPAVQLALMQHRIGDSDGVEPRSLDELAAQVRGPLAEAEIRADDVARLSLVGGLIVELQAYGKDERALRLLSRTCAQATSGLRSVGQVPLAWIAAERCAEAVRLVGDPVLVAASEFSWAHAQSPDVRSRALPPRRAAAGDRPGALPARPRSLPAGRDRAAAGRAALAGLGPGLALGAGDGRGDAHPLPAGGWWPGAAGPGLSHGSRRSLTPGRGGFKPLEIHRELRSYGLPARPARLHVLDQPVPAGGGHLIVGSSPTDATGLTALRAYRRAGRHTARIT